MSNQKVEDGLGFGVLGSHDDRGKKDCVKCGMAQGEALAKRNRSNNRMLTALHKIAAYWNSYGCWRYCS